MCVWLFKELELVIDNMVLLWNARARSQDIRGGGSGGSREVPICLNSDDKKGIFLHIWGVTPL